MTFEHRRGPQQQGAFEDDPQPLTPEERFQVAINDSLELMDAAEEANISFSVGELAILYGMKPSSFGSVAMNGLKRVLPSTRSTAQKLKKVEHILLEREERAVTEWAATEAMDEWIVRVGPDRIQSIQIRDTNYGDPFMSPLTLTIEGDRSPEKCFELKHHFGTESAWFPSLPTAVQERLTARRTFWRNLGAENGTMVEELLQKHFEKIPVDLTNENVVSELRWLQTADPETYQQLQRLQVNQGTPHNLFLWRLTKSPPKVIEDVLHIAKNTQEKFISTWLPGWVKREHMPVILDSDIQAMQITRDAVVKRLTGKKSARMNEFERVLSLKKLEEDWQVNADFYGSLENIQRLRSLVFGLEIEGDCSEEEEQIMRRANDLLDLDLSGEKVAQRLIIDTSLHTSEGITSALKTVGLLVPTAILIEHIPIPFIAQFAKALGSADDGISEVGEVRSLHTQGFQWKELVQRSGIILPVAIGAVALGGSVEYIDGHVSRRLAGILFALSAFATTATTLGLTTHAFAKGYRRLAQQGKLIEQPYLDAERAAALRQAVTSPLTDTAIQERLVPLLDVLTNNPDVDQRDLEKRLAAIEAAARAGLAKQAVQHATPTWREAYAAAYTEVFDMSPPRQGQLRAIALMAIIATVAGDGILASPAIYVPFGMGEVFGGLASAKIASILEERRWQAKVQKHIKRAQSIGLRP